jgi:uncharacterized protein (DUF4213/DUF364 family)
MTCASNGSETNDAPKALGGEADLIAASERMAQQRWHLYDELIAGVPEDVLVTRACLGNSWTYVEAECGMGVAMTCRGGAPRTDRAPLAGRPLREVAAFAKSWNFGQATLGVAALNAWYSRREALEAMGATFDDEGEQPEGHERAADAFAVYAPQMAGKNVCVIGHFPHVERIALQRGGNLTVLERNCTSDLDTPDPACEYVIPEQDLLFMTGVTITNKTVTRLLELARLSSRTRTIMVGPSIIPAPLMFEQEGVECLAGSVVVDPDGVRELVERGAGQLFGNALLMFDCFAPGADARACAH